MKVEVAVLAPVPNKPTFPVDVKQHFNHPTSPRGKAVWVAKAVLCWIPVVNSIQFSSIQFKNSNHPTRGNFVEVSSVISSQILCSVI